MRLWGEVTYQSPLGIKGSRGWCKVSKLIIRQRAAKPLQIRNCAQNSTINCVKLNGLPSDMKSVSASCPVTAHTSSMSCFTFSSSLFTNVTCLMRNADYSSYSWIHNTGISIYDNTESNLTGIWSIVKEGQAMFFFFCFTANGHFLFLKNTAEMLIRDTPWYEVSDRGFPIDKEMCTCMPKNEKGRYNVLHDEHF